MGARRLAVAILTIPLFASNPVRAQPASDTLQTRVKSECRISCEQRGLEGGDCLTPESCEAQCIQHCASDQWATWKNPSTSLLLSIFFVGGGYFYSGQTGRGLALAVPGYGALIGGWAWTLSTADDVECSGGGLNVVCESKTNYTPLIGATMIHALTWALGMVGAESAAIDYNRRHGLERPRYAVGPDFQAITSGGFAARMVYTIE